MKLTEIAVDRPITTIMAVLIVIAVSVVALSKLPINLMPDVTFPALSISTTYRGASPEEIETLVTRPVEEAMSSVEGVDEMESTSSEEASLVRLRFVWGADLEEVADDVRTRLDRIRDALPEDIEPPVLYKFDFDQRPIMRFGLFSDAMSSLDLRHMAETTFKNRLERVNGVASADVGGGRVREIQVNLSQEKLDALDFSPLIILDAIRAENVNLPAGEVNEGETQLVMRTQGQFGSPSELERIVVATRDGVPIYLRDVADVVDGFEEVRTVERINGRPGITITIMKQSGSNTVAVEEAVKAEADLIRRDHPQVNMVTLFESSTYIKQSIANVRTAAIFGAGLAVIILLVFLRNVRSTLIIASAIPISVMATFSLIYFAGFTLNTISFGGLALGVGLLLDNSIVVLENIFRHREAGENGRTAAITGTQEVSMAITASTLTTLVVFLPLVFVTGAASVMFSEMGYVVAFSLACSLFVALTLIPTLARRLLKIESLEATANESLFHKAYRISEYGFRKLDNGYRRTLHFALRHRLLFIMGSVTIFAAVMPFFRTLGFEYMPQTDEGEVRIYGEMAPGTKLEVMDEAFTHIEQRVNELAGDEIETVYTSFGLGQWYRASGTNTGSLELNLVDFSERDRSSEEIATALRELESIPGMRVRTRASGGMFFMRFLQGQGESIGIEIRGHDRDAALRVAEQVQNALNSTEGISDTRLSREGGRPEIGLRIDRQKAAEVGLSVNAIAQTIRANFGGEIATQFREGGDEYNVRVRLREEDRQRLQDLESLWIVTPSGERAPASNFVVQKRQIGPTQIRRINQERTITVAANLDEGYSLGNVMQDVQDRLTGITLPRDFTLVYGGEFEDQQESYAQLTMGLILAILLVYMVMAAQFESLLHPLIIMFAIPFGGIGVFLALKLTNTTVNVQSILGVIMLAGIVVNNAIVLVDYINLLRRKHGMDLETAVEEAGRRRLRPILMTTLTTALALVPMALGLGAGGELQSPMARVVIGGLLTSTLITLVFVPALYTTVEETRMKLLGRREARVPEDAPLHSVK